MRHSVLIILFTFCLLKSWAQTNQNVDRGNIIEQRIEQIAEAAEDENLDYTTLFEQLAVYLDFPLNLNTASVDDLYGLGLLTNGQILNFLDYLNEYGQLFSLYELAFIDGWDQATAELILPFVRVTLDETREKITFQRLRDYGKSEIVVRWQRILEDQVGYSPISEDDLAESPNSRYLGSPDKLFARYRYRYGDRISFGMTAEKDNGEEFFRGSQPNGFDFYSGHVYLKDFGMVKQLAIGDFQAQFGQGLTFWSGLGFNRKSSFSVSTAQDGRGITPYTSINENLFLRGGAVTLNQGKFDFTAFYSGKRIDGNLTDFEPNDSLDFSEPEVLITSFQETGFHRTVNEIADKDAIFQEHYGGHLQYRTSNFQLGVTAAHMQLDGEINRNTDFYSQFRFNGTENTTVGADYFLRLANFRFFGETARSASGGIATMNGVNIEMNSRLLVNITQRHYEKDFQGVASVGFGEGTLVENESGVYMGVEFRPFKRWKINAYIDQFKFPWLRFQTDAPSSGYDFFGQLEYQASGKTNMYLRYRDRLRQTNTRDEVDGADFLVDNPRKNLRLNFSHSATRQIRLRSRIELTEFGRGNEPISRGFMAYQDVIWDVKNLPLRIAARYALFDTDNYDSRIYAYENDVLYFFSIPAYGGRGTRAYILIKYDLGRNTDIWLRVAQTYFTDRQVVGSGLEEIDGNTRTEMKFQIRHMF
ncbi:MAG: hypothetical protein ACJAQ4_001297 [Cryomorphaceae bacterium]|jgi:hypothetical protein